ncbi:MAG: hypothetical protein WDN47_01180 [Candidatus Doudnabacteria bacterium]
MRNLVLVSLTVLVVSSFFTALFSRKRTEESNWASIVFCADLFFAFVGMIIVGWANAAATNQFAKYQEGFPDVDMGGLPVDVIIGNMLIFCTPLIIWGLGRLIGGRLRRSPRTITI